jgi:hypothetical protein
MPAPRHPTVRDLAAQWEQSTGRRLTEKTLDQATASVLPGSQASANYTKRKLQEIARAEGVSAYDMATPEERCRYRHHPDFDHSTHQCRSY